MRRGSVYGTVVGSTRCKREGEILTRRDGLIGQPADLISVHGSSSLLLVKTCLCSSVGLECHPVKVEVAGSSPVTVASNLKEVSLEVAIL